jgi:hypothetical protein
MAEPVKPRDAHIPERLYRMMRIGAGDYLLPSNDLRTLWRISTYDDEDITECDRAITVWGVASRPYPRSPDYIDLADWAGWEQYSYGHRTRKGAIQSAMTAT